MKILMVTSSYPKYEGDVTAPFIESIAASIAARGNEVHVLAPYHPDLKRAPVEKGVHLHFFKYAPLRHLNIWGYAEALEADVRVKGAIFPLTPVVFASSLWSLLQLTRQIKFDIMHAHWVVPNGPVAGLVARLRRLPLVVSLHGSDIFIAEHSRLISSIARRVFRAASAITAPSDDLRDRATRLGAPANRCHLVPYGVDPSKFTRIEGAGPLLRKELGLPEDSVVIFAVGRMVYKKGFEYLIRALPAVLREHPNARIVLAGGGDLESKLVSLVRQLGVEKSVIMPGWVSRDKLPLYFSGCDLFVLPSVVDQQGNVDGLPNTLLEAMASARPVVATNVAGIPLAVKDGENGLVVPEKQPGELSAAINLLLRAPDLRQQYGEASRRRVEDDLNWDTTARTFENLYHAASSRRRKSKRHGEAAGNQIEGAQ
ncbi:MAG TPA: glycosyltransferase family 4 protein [Chloroflexia bacterium]|jgi:glycosyltransferase involved in cell wall biosynthesis